VLEHHPQAGLNSRHDSFQFAFVLIRFGSLASFTYSLLSYGAALIVFSSGTGRLGGAVVLSLGFTAAVFFLAKPIARLLTFDL
jgi:hypothetical protein